MYLKYFIVIFTELFKFSGKLSLREFVIRMIVTIVYSIIGVIVTLVNQEWVYAHAGVTQMERILQLIWILTPFFFFLILCTLFSANVFMRRLRALGLSVNWAWLVFAPYGALGLFLYCVLKKEPKDNSIQ